MFDFSDVVTDWLNKNGWYSDRRVDAPSWIPSDHPAHSILASFDGLSLLRYDDGFPDDPMAEIDFHALDQNDVTASVWSSLLRSTVIGIGSGHNRHENVYVDTEGRIYAASLVHDAFYLRGLSLRSCLHNLWTRQRARPMLRPDQTSVILYGEEFTKSSPEIYRYSEAK